jgi:hypothetical protein
MAGFQAAMPSVGGLDILADERGWSPKIPPFLFPKTESVEITTL